MEKIGIFGGTFNPIHLGHTNFCGECQRRFQFDRLLLIPTNLPPHKAAPELASNEDRLNIVRLAARKLPGAEASDLEYRLGGRSYTVRTLEFLRQEYPQAQLCLLIGSDMLRSFRQWKDFERILGLAQLIAGARMREEYDELLSVRDGYGELARRITVAQLPVREISSTQIRELLRTGGDVTGLLDPLVYAYIRERGLYGCGGSGEEHEKER